MSSGFGPLANFVGRQTHVPADDPFGLVHSYASYLDSVTEEPRTGFHVSSLFRFCPVEWCLNQVLKKPKKIPYRLRFRFDIGHSLHTMIQNHFGGMGILKGFWRCGNGHETDKVGFRPEKCHACESKSFSYKEIRVEDLQYGIVGRTDGVLSLDGEDVGLEIKSVDTNGLNMFQTAPGYASSQLNVYAHLLRQSLFPELKRGVILLAALSDKDSVLLPVKTFVCEYTDAPWKEAIKRVQCARNLFDQYKRGELSVPDLISFRSCATKSVGRQAGCIVCDECFSTPTLSKLIGEGDKNADKNPETQHPG